MVLEGKNLNNKKIYKKIYNFIYYILYYIYSVYLAEKSSVKYALKFIDKSLIIENDLISNIKTELTLTKTLSHQNIIKVYEILSTTQKIIFVEEYISGGDLFDLIKNYNEQQRLPEDLSRTYFQQIISALEYCHNKNIIHRDLKPENILIDNKTNLIKISDFGLSIILKEKEEKLYDFCGTTNYVAPEIIKEVSGIFTMGGYNGQPVDIWSAGVILYNMVSGENPFYNKDKTIRINNILNGKVEYPNYFSQGLIDLLKNIFVIQPSMRYTIKDIKQHFWFKYGFVDVNYNENKLNLIVYDLKLKIEEKNIRFINCLELSSLITGNLMNNMFNNKKHFYFNNKKIFLENRDKYFFGYFGNFHNLEFIICDYFNNGIKEAELNILFKKKSKWNINLKLKNQFYNIIFDLILYKISNTKFIIGFIYIEGNKFNYCNIINNFLNKNQTIFKFL